MKSQIRIIFKVLVIVLMTSLPASCSADPTATNQGPTAVVGDRAYNIVDTGQTLCYGNTTPVATPVAGEAFYGQDANYSGNGPEYQDNGNGTVTDMITDLMWQQDPGAKMNMAEAEALISSFSLAGHSDWRLPTAKELQSIVDYTRCPATHGTPAIDPAFASSQIVDESGGSDFAFYWSGTTHANFQGNGAGAYVAFGSGLGFMEMPPGSGNFSLLDVHGAGCQRSDPKDGDPADYPVGLGPQGDVIRILNHVRCVRTAVETSSADVPELHSTLSLAAAPNPFNPMTNLSFFAPTTGRAMVEIFDLNGRLHATITDQVQAIGEHSLFWNGTSKTGHNLPSGVYLARLSIGSASATTKLTLVR